MSGTLSKRQQARNERALQDLIKTIPGNSVCADCSARNPGWASWSLGIFLCMRCAAIHRKLGTHITKVKSLSMDSWSNDQVENMKQVGNVISNRMYNPNNAKPPIPFDADEADSAMERFIRGKYAERAASRHDTGSTNSDDNPPPLPPKTGSRFGFRSAPSIFPLSSSRMRRERPPPVDIIPTRRRSPSPDYAPPSKSKNIDAGPMDLAGKMNRLKDMGFTDPKRNLAVLNGLGGNLEKTIDTLVRLGEGNGNRAGSSRGSRTPVTPKFPNSPLGRSEKKPSPPVSSNPFDLLDVPQPPAPQSSQSTGSKANLQSPANTNPFLSPAVNTNPFGVSPSQSQYNINAAFQNLEVSNQQNTQQPLFPNHTGGFPLSQAQNPQMYQQSPPVPSMPQQYFPNSNAYNSQVQPIQNTNYNPFLQQPVQHQQAQSVNSTFQTNPYTQQQMFSSPVQTSHQQQFPSSIFDQQSQQQAPTQTQPQQQAYNPFLQQATQSNPAHSYQQQQQQQTYDYQNQQQQSYPQHAQTYPMPTQQPTRPNTQSIMDLFNYPQLAPSKPQAETQYTQEQPQSQNSNFAVAPAQSQQQQFNLQSQPNGQAASNNPFNNGKVNNYQAAQQNGDVLGSMPSFQQAPQQQNGTRHVSQESISISAGGWENGRHSPDAWGTISGRSMR